MILDEAQTIKNHASQTAQAVKRLAAAPYRLALTGSPIENSLDDLHSILQFVEPACAGSLQESGREASKSLTRRCKRRLAARSDDRTSASTLRKAAKAGRSPCLSALPGRSSLQKLSGPRLASAAPRLQAVMLRRETGEEVQMVSKEELEVAVKMARDQATIYKARCVASSPRSGPEAGSPDRFSRARGSVPLRASLKASSNGFQCFRWT